MKLKHYVGLFSGLAIVLGAVLGGISSAQAWYNLTLTNSVTDFDRNTPTPPMVLTIAQFTPGTSGFSTITVDYRDAGGYYYWTWKNSCSGSGLTLASCGISSVALNGVNQTPQSVALVNSGGGPGVEITLSSTVTVATTVVITFTQGAMTTPNLPLGSIAEVFFGPYAGPGQMDDSGASGIINVNSVVTFHANGGTGSNTTQGANYNQHLTANTFTRAGYTFAGWATSNSTSTVAYNDNASYNFANNADLYAVWTPVVSTSSPSPTATIAPTATTETTLANTGEGFPDGVGIAAVLISYGVLVLIIQHRRKRT